MEHPTVTSPRNDAPETGFPHCIRTKPTCMVPARGQRLQDLESLHVAESFEKRILNILIYSTNIYKHTNYI
jgi:hypothetical protein